MKFETLAVHAGNDEERSSGSVAPDIVLSTTFRYTSTPEGISGGYIYTRSGNPNRHALEQALAALEGGAGAFAFASGLAAVSAMVQAARSESPDLHVLIPDDVYHGTRHLLLQLFAQMDVACDSVDMTAPERVAAALRPQTRLLWVESPSNPLLKIADLQALADVAHAHGALYVVDNTWSTPVIQRPLELGADVVMYSTTKYFGGHSDVLGGALIVRDGLQDTLGQRLDSIQHLMGAVPSPFDCWLLRRSMATLPLRVRQQSANAAQIAAYLEQHPQVEAVYYPGLESHPQHAIARRQMHGGFGGMLSFCVRGGAAATSRVVNRVKLIQQATSLGGVESLLEHRHLSEGPDSTTPPNLIRFSVGIESVDDLIADLAQALG